MKDDRSVYYQEFNSPIGLLTIASTEKGICWIEFGGLEENISRLQRFTKKWLKEYKLVESEAPLKEAVTQLNDYFAKRRQYFELPLDLYGTPFQKLVWNTLMQIPFGEVRSYKDVAIQMNAPKSVRAIGSANHYNPVPIIVPCHRVIGSNGNLIGYRGGTEIKQYLLNLEGKTFDLEQK